MLTTYQFEVQSDGVKAPSFGTGEAQYLNPVTGRVDVTLATEQRMRHAIEETLFDPHSLVPDALVKDLPFVLLLGTGDNVSCSSRELSHRIADSQIFAAVNMGLGKDEMKKMNLRADYIAQWADPLSLLGGFWFSYWRGTVENVTSASASLYEATIVARNAVPRLAGATKFSRLKVNKDTLESIGAYTKGGPFKKYSEGGFGMIPAKDDQHRFAVESVELRISDVRQNGFKRMRARGVHEATIELLDAVLDLMIARLLSGETLHLRSRCTLRAASPKPVDAAIESRVTAAIGAYLSARATDFDGNPNAVMVRETLEKIPTLNDSHNAERPAALVWSSMAVPQTGDDEKEQGAESGKD